MVNWKSGYTRRHVGPAGGAGGMKVYNIDPEELEIFEHNGTEYLKSSDGYVWLMHEPSPKQKTMHGAKAGLSYAGLYDPGSNKILTHIAEPTLKGGPLKGGRRRSKRRRSRTTRRRR